MAFAILIIYALGYHSLAIFMGVRILVSILLLLSAYGLQQVIWLTALSLVSLTKRVTSLKGQRIAQGLLRVLRMIVLIITALLTVSLLLEIWGMAGGYQAILRLAQRPFFEIQGTQISLLSMFKFSVALFGSLWLSGWLRKKLGEFIYPVLRITIANRHASDTILHYGIIIIGVLAGLQWMGMGIGVLAIFAGVIGIGVGFGMQDIANNFISGLIITFGKSVKVGDIIEVNDILGTVREISARSTTLEAPDGKMLLLPNALLLTSQVINWSIGSTRAIISLPVTVKIGNRPESVQSALTELSLEHPLVLSQPPPAVYFDGFGDNTLDFRLELAITTPLERDRILSDIRFSLAQQLPHKGIEIPHSFDVRDPQTDVRP
jgi:small-conductance mechanosensitive channel